MVAERDTRDLAAGMLDVDRVLAPRVPERRQRRRLDLRLDDRRHQGGLAFLVEVVRREVDRVDRLDEEEPRLRRGQLDPVGRAFRDRDVNVLAEPQVAVLRSDDAYSLLYEVHLMPLAVPEERLRRHRGRGL